MTEATLRAELAAKTRALETAEAECGRLREQSDEATRSKEFTQQWYATRIERLRDLAKEHGIWDKVAAIIANGTLAGLPGLPYEPPTYAQMLNQERHRAEHAEQERDTLRAQLAEAEARLVIFGPRLTAQDREIERLVERLQQAEDRLTACEPVIEAVRELQQADQRITEHEARRDQGGVVKAIGDYNDAAQKLRRVTLPAKVTT